MFFSACSSWFFKMLFLNIPAVTSLVWSKISSSVSAYPTIFLFRFWYQLFIWQMCCRAVESNLMDDVAHLVSSRELKKAIAYAEAPKIFMDCAWFSCNHVVTTTINYYGTYWWDWRENLTTREFWLTKGNLIRSKQQKQQKLGNRERNKHPSLAHDVVTFSIVGYEKELESAPLMWAKIAILGKEKKESTTVLGYGTLFEVLPHGN